MMEENFETTREELYEKVWSRPLVHLAKEFGISDVGLGKICKRHNIPRPPVGYWAKVRSGHNVRKRKLPPSERGDELITIRPSNSSSTSTCLSADSLPEEFQLHIIEANKKVATSQLDTPSSSLHPLVRCAKKTFKKTSTDYRGTLLPKDGCLNIHVTEHTLERALDFLDTLFKLIEECGYGLSVAQNNRVTLDILGEEFELRLSEPFKREEIRRTSMPRSYDRGTRNYLDGNSHQEYIR